jgi:putative ABC transport system permease protein
MSNRWGQFLESWVGDTRYALRGLRNEPGYAVTAVLTLALGLGAVTAMLAVLDSVLLRPVALPHPDRLVVLQEEQTTSGVYGVSIKDLEALQRAARSFSAIAGYEGLPGPVDAGDGARVEPHTTVTPELFQAAGVAAAQGRLLGAADAHAQNAVVSDEFWRDVMHARRDVIGAVLMVNKKPYTVVGVLPHGFRFPDGVAGPQVFTPIQLDASGKTAYGFDSVDVVARLRPRASIAAANAELASLWKRIDPKAAKDTRLVAAGYQQHNTQNERGGLFALLGACVLLLAIACVNFANLQIARYTVRAEAMRVRLALGATRTRLLRQISTESVLLSGLGAGLGLGAAIAVVHATRTAYAQQYAGFERLGVHPLTLLALGGLVVATGLVTALVPAWRGLRTPDGAVRLQASRTVARSRISAWLVVVEIALTCVLVVTAGLMLRTFRAHLQAPLGFNPGHMTVVTLMPQDMQESVAALKLTEQRVLEAFRGLPGVQAAAVQLSVPFSKFTFGYSESVEFPGSREKELFGPNTTLTDAGYLSTMGVHVVYGRGFTPSDAQGAGVVLVNESFAREYLGGNRAVGRMLQMPSQLPSTSKEKNAKPKQLLYRVVGVVPDEVTGREIRRPVPTVYLNWSQMPAEATGGRFLFGIAPQFAVRSTLPQAVLEHELRSALKNTAPDMAVMQIAPVTQAIEKSLDQQRLELRLAAGFGAIALLLAAVGIYGVLAYTVAQRRREIGIRMALGSSRAGAMRLVARQALWMVAVGLAAGFAGAWPAGQAVRSFLFGV